MPGAALERHERSWVSGRRLGGEFGVEVDKRFDRRWVLPARGSRAIRPSPPGTRRLGLPRPHAENVKYRPGGETDMFALPEPDRPSCAGRVRREQVRLGCLDMGTSSDSQGDGDVSESQMLPVIFASGIPPMKKAGVEAPAKLPMPYHATPYQTSLFMANLRALASCLALSRDTRSRTLCTRAPHIRALRYAIVCSFAMIKLHYT